MDNLQIALTPIQNPFQSHLHRNDRLPPPEHNGYLFELINIDTWTILTPLHTPIGAILTAGIATQLFTDKNKIYSLLILGAATHFALDLMLIHLSGGVALLFPFHWSTYGLDLITTDSSLPARI